MSAVENTLMGSAGPVRCPACQLAVTRPFCPRDGSLAGAPFTIGERYVAEGLIGAGGWAFVFAARHRVLGKPVAVKILRPDLAEQPDEAQRFLREARTTSLLRHENIVNVLDFGRDEPMNAWYLVMERLTGRPLCEVLREAGALPWAHAVPILLQLARALSVAHDAGVIHRDLTPKNIFLGESSGRTNVVKLCEFGLSRPIQPETDARIATAEWSLGTPAYAAPEQIHGAEPDHRADLYALGVTAYELLTGTLPPVAVMASTLAGPPIPLAERLRETPVPPALEEIVMRCLAADPGERPASAGEIEGALCAALQPGAIDVPTTSEVIGQMAGSYRIMALLGAGGASSVYLGEHPVLGSRAAVKVLLPELAAVPSMVKRFVAEARTANSLGSPHVPKHYDFGTLPNGSPFAVMEVLDGEGLDAHLARRGQLSVAEVRHILEQVARVMDQAHAVGVVHRDLKPENLFLVDGEHGPVVKVLDFGIAVLTGPSADMAPRLTIPGLMMGTPSYCAPEQAYGHQEITAATDVYALGATAFKLLTGRCPFEGEVAEILVDKSTTDAPSARAFRPDLPEAVEHTVARMLAREPGERPATMAALLSELAKWETPTEPDGTDLRPADRQGRRVAAFAFAGVALLCLGSVAWLGLAHLRREPAPEPRRSVAQGAADAGPAAPQRAAARVPDDADPAKPEPAAAGVTGDAGPDVELRRAAGVGAEAGPNELRRAAAAAGAGAPQRAVARAPDDASRADSGSAPDRARIAEATSPAGEPAVAVGVPTARPAPTRRSRRRSDDEVLLADPFTDPDDVLLADPFEE